jgi:hypothetical protein
VGGRVHARQGVADGDRGGLAAGSEAGSVGLLCLYWARRTRWLRLRLGRVLGGLEGFELFGQGAAREALGLRVRLGLTGDGVGWG